jgi:hypothetical protein
MGANSILKKMGDTRAIISNWRLVEKAPILNGQFTLYLTPSGNPCFLTATALPPARENRTAPELALYRNLFPDAGIVVLEPTRAFVDGKWMAYTSSLGLTSLPVPVMMLKTVSTHPERYAAMIGSQYLHLGKRMARVVEDKREKIQLLLQALTEASAAATATSVTVANSDGYALMRRLQASRTLISILQKEQIVLSELIGEFLHA